MKIEFLKHIVKTRIKYSFPAKYSTKTHYRLFIDDVFIREIIIGVHFDNFKSFLKILKQKYTFDTYSVKNNGVMYQDFQSI